MEPVHLLNAYAPSADPVEDCRRRQRQFLRLSAAAALQTHAGFTAVQAWNVSGKLPEAVMMALREAAENPISTRARADVLAIVERHVRSLFAKQPTPYPLFAEPCQTAPPLSDEAVEAGMRLFWRE